MDFVWYFTVFGFFWDAVLKDLGVEFELFKDVDMFLMIERGMCGVLMISKRYARVNNKYMGEDYDKSKLSRYIIYFDANNFYGWATC